MSKRANLNRAIFFFSPPKISDICYNFNGFVSAGVWVVCSRHKNISIKSGYVDKMGLKKGSQTSYATNKLSDVHPHHTHSKTS